jgi:hypothetical protein
MATANVVVRAIALTPWARPHVHGYTLRMHAPGSSTFVEHNISAMIGRGAGLSVSRSEKDDDSYVIRGKVPLAQGFSFVQLELLGNESPAEGLEGKNTIGIAPVDVTETSVQQVRFYDTSMRDASTGDYIDIGTVSVQVEEVPVPVHTYRLTQDDMQTLVSAADAERRDLAEFYEQVKTDKKKIPVVDESMRHMFLQRYTTTWGSVPAYYFAMLTDRDTPPETQFVTDIFNQVCQSQQHLPDDIRRNMTAISRELDTRNTKSKISDAMLRDALLVLGEVLSVIGSSCYYTGDHATVNDASVAIERFQMSTRCELCLGDCEDVAAEIFSFATLLSRVDPQTTGDMWGFYRLLRAYQYMIVTGVATSPSLQKPDANESGATGDDYICHVWTVAVPNITFAALMDTEGLETYAGHTSMAGRLHRFGPLILEGTNYASALPRTINSYIKDAVQAGKIIEQMRTKRAWRLQWEDKYPALREVEFTLQPEHIDTPTDSNNPASSSIFYRWAVSAWVLPWGDQPKDETPIEYQFYQQSQEGGEYTTLGITYDHLINLGQDATRSVRLRGAGAYAPGIDPVKRRLSKTQTDVLLAFQPPRIDLTALVQHDGKKVAHVMLGEDAAKHFEYPAKANLPGLYSSSVSYRFKGINSITEKQRAALRDVILTTAEVSHFTINVIRVTRLQQIVIVTIFMDDGDTPESEFMEMARQALK